jgi:hypothetical protein
MVQPHIDREASRKKPPIKLSSHAFAEGERLAMRHTADGEDLSPGDHMTTPMTLPAPIPQPPTPVPTPGPPAPIPEPDPAPNPIPQPTPTY